MIVPENLRSRYNPSPAPQYDIPCLGKPHIIPEVLCRRASGSRSRLEAGGAPDLPKPLSAEGLGVKLHLGLIDRFGVRALGSRARHGVDSAGDA